MIFLLFLLEKKVLFPPQALICTNTMIKGEPWERWPLSKHFRGSVLHSRVPRWCYRNTPNFPTTRPLPISWISNWDSHWLTQNKYSQGTRTRPRPYPNHWTTRKVKGLKVPKQIPDFELSKFQWHVYQIALLWMINEKIINDYNWWCQGLTSQHVCGFLW